ncbi:hypothetical protein ABZ851_12865 [Streptomyces sp. NPDC047049]|uniref:hypothetical protein n=1 Tax=Streptomyces sp. NPDC047049 TaxID=3156688 RepID=UPI0033F78892
MPRDEQVAATREALLQAAERLFAERGVHAVTRLEGQNWRTPQSTGGDLTYWAPALAVAHGRLYYAVTGTNKKLYWNTFNEATSSWNSSATFDGSDSDLAPALAPEYSGRLWMTRVGTDGRLYLNTHDGTEWSRRYNNNLRWSVDSPVAMTPYNGHLWRIARGMDHRVYTSTSPGGAEWTDRGHPSNWKTAHRPALAVHDNKMWLFLRGTDGRLWASSYQTSWGAISRIEGSLMDEPTAASHDGKLYVMYRR